MSIEDLLKIEMTNFEKCKSNVSKLNHINNIIQLKTRISHPSKIDSIYKDIKVYLSYYLKAIDESIYEYDKLDQGKITKTISLLPIDQQLCIYKYFERQLKHYNYDEEISWVSLSYKKALISAIWKNNTRSNNRLLDFFRLLLTISSLSPITLLFTLSLIFLVTYIALLPAQSPGYALFNIKYHYYNSNFYINHLFNVLSIFFDSNNDFKITPTGVTGFTVAILFKVFMLIIVGNFLLKELEDRLKP